MPRVLRLKCMFTPFESREVNALFFFLDLDRGFRLHRYMIMLRHAPGIRSN